MSQDGLAAVHAAADAVSGVDHKAAIAALETKHAADLATAVASAKADGAKEGAAAERTRIAGILRHESAERRGPAALALALDTDMPLDAAVKVLAVTPENKPASRLENVPVPEVDDADDAANANPAVGLAAALDKQIASITGKRA